MVVFATLFLSHGLMVSKQCKYHNFCKRKSATCYSEIYLSCDSC